MIGFLLDTNVIAELISVGGSQRVKQWAAAQDEATLYLSILTIAEYDKGIANLAEGDPKRHVYGAARDRMADRFNARLLSISDPVVRRWGSISGRVRRDSRHPPPVIDTLLAATVLQHDLYLVTRNVRDVQASGAAVFNPCASPVALSDHAGHFQSRKESTSFLKKRSKKLLSLCITPGDQRHALPYE